MYLNSHCRNPNLKCELKLKKGEITNAVGANCLHGKQYVCVQHHFSLNLFLYHNLEKLCFFPQKSWGTTWFINVRVIWTWWENPSLNWWSCRCTCLTDAEELSTLWQLLLHFIMFSQVLMSVFSNTTCCLKEWVQIHLKYISNHGHFLCG